MQKTSRVTRDRVHERLDTETASRILDSAIELFAERGFSDVTVRDIAEQAGANPAAISYYFGAKEQLIRRSIQSVVAPLNEKRLAALDLAEAKSACTIADIVRALVVPTVTACMQSSGPDRHYARVLVLSFALRQQFVDDIMAEQNDRIALRFVDALTRASPSRDRARMFWCFDFMIGATMHILLDSFRGNRLRRLSGGAADTSDSDAIISELVKFIAEGTGS